MVAKFPPNHRQIDLQKKARFTPNRTPKKKKNFQGGFGGLLVRTPNHFTPNAYLGGDLE